MKHALVIGGTGMLADVSVYLSKNGYHVSVVGRNPEKMQDLLEQNSAQMTPVFVDYTNSEEFAERIYQIQIKNGPIQLVVAWIHSTGPNVILSLIRSLPPSVPWELFHVTGSSSNLRELKAKLNVPLHVKYHQIMLGFKIDKGMSRWLTNKEISDGVVKAIQEKKLEQIIGTVQPWEKRP